MLPNPAFHREVIKLRNPFRKERKLTFKSRIVKRAEYHIKNANFIFNILSRFFDSDWTELLF